MADNQVTFENNIISVNAALDEVGEQWLNDATRVLLNQVQRNTAVDTGQLKASWDRKVTDDKGVVGSTSQNAIWEEFGTGHYALEGKGRKTPWYVPVEGYLGHKKPTFQGKVVIVYGKGGKAFYKTDGKRPRRAFQKAFDSTKPKIEKRLKDLLKEKIGHD